MALSRGDRDAAIAISAGRMGFYLVRAANQWNISKTNPMLLLRVKWDAATAISTGRLGLDCKHPSVTNRAFIRVATGTW